MCWIQQLLIQMMTHQGFQPIPLESPHPLNSMDLATRESHSNYLLLAHYYNIKLWSVTCTEPLKQTNLGRYTLSPRSSMKQLLKRRPPSKYQRFVIVNLRGECRGYFCTTEQWKPE